MSDLLTELETRRNDEGLSEMAFASLLGISQSTYSRIKGRVYPPSGKFITGALRRYPDLAAVLADDATAAEDAPNEEGAA